jgi:hypothetical protein
MDLNLVQVEFASFCKETSNFEILLSTVMILFRFFSSNFKRYKVPCETSLWKMTSASVAAYRFRG